MRTSLIGAHADHRPNDFHFARTQREAGIEHLEWEDRLAPPFKSFANHVIIALCWMLLVLSAAGFMIQA